MPSSSPAFRKVLLTGATGFVGSNLAIELLRDPAVELYCLVRPQGDTQARLNAAILASAEAAEETGFAAENIGRVRAIPGDLTQPLLGISAADRLVLREAGICEVWHAAASLRFEEHHRQDILRQNVEGTRSLLALAREIGVREFQHISTAYVSGTRKGVIPEEAFDPAYEPHNCYEESKRLGEELVLAAAAPDFRVRIFRPSIVIGHSRTHNSTSDSGLYGFLSGIERFREELDGKVPGYLARHPLRVQGSAEAALNLIPVDVCVREAVALARDERAAGTFFHLTNPYPVRLDVLTEAVNSVLTGVRVERAETLTELRPADTLFRSRVVFYEPYLRNEQVFERRRDGAAPPRALALTQADVELHSSNFLARYQEERAELAVRATQVVRRMQRVTFACRFGDELAYYTTGDGPPLVLVNAYGVSLEFWKKTLAVLAPHYRILTWESRGLLSGPADRPFCVADHADDLAEILDHAGVSRTHVAGWCTGPKVALEFAARHPQRVASLAFITGSLAPLEGVPAATRYDQVIGRVAELVCRRPDMADVFLAAVSGVFGSGAKQAAEPDELVGDLMGMVSPRLRNMIVGPFLSETVIAKYAAMVADFQTHDISHLLAEVRVPTLVIGAENDVIAHPAFSQAAAERIAGARHFTLRGASHWCLMENGDELGEELKRFLGEIATAESNQVRPAQSACLLSSAAG